ncbi:hypothetical protein JCM6882_005413 [Rhodosporidiobolus microsporus]
MSTTPSPRLHAPPARPPPPPSLPKINLPPSQILRLIPWAVVETYALPHFPADVLALRPEYAQQARQAIKTPEATRWPAWLLEWYRTIAPAAFGLVAREDGPDRAALRSYQSYLALVDEMPDAFDAEVVQKAREEEEELKERIWQRWERLLGFYVAAFQLQVSDETVDPSAPRMRSPPPISYRRVSPFAFPYFGPSATQSLNILHLDPRDRAQIERFTFPNPFESTSEVVDV